MNNKSLSVTMAILVISMSSFSQIKRTITDKRVNKIGPLEQLHEPVTFTDSRDGKIYKTVRIGTQTWMAENLAYKANTGCWAYDNNPSYVAKYGYLYDWQTAKAVCPSGWHLPSYAEWTTLINYLGGDSIAGKNLKERGTTDWESPNSGATDIAGFKALPGGLCEISNGSPSFGRMGVRGFWWSSTTYPNTTWGARNLVLSSNLNIVYPDIRGVGDGFSVRCIKDQAIY